MYKCGVCVPRSETNLGCLPQSPSTFLLLLLLRMICLFDFVCMHCVHAIPTEVQKGTADPLSRELQRVVRHLVSDRN